MHVHVLGICGYATFGAASLAQARGDRVTGSDDHAYPPMSDAVATLVRSLAARGAGSPRTGRVSAATSAPAQPPPAQPGLPAAAVP